MIVATAPVRKARFVDVAPDDDFWRRLHRLADQAYPGIRDEVLRALREIAPRASRAELLRLVTGQQVEGATAALQELWTLQAEQWAEGELTQRLTRLAVDAAEATPGVTINAPRFNVQDPEALQTIQRRIGDRIVAISDTTRESVRGIVQRAFESGTPLTQQMDEIAATVGLTPRQAESVARFREGLVEAGTKPSEQTRLVQQRVDALKRQRAEAIARTESIDAASSGQQARWEQSARDGFLDVQVARRHWVITPGDRLCPVCAAIPGMNPEGVRLREPFQLPVGVVFLSPAHVQCRCAVSLTTGDDFL